MLEQYLHDIFEILHICFFVHKWKNEINTEVDGSEKCCKSSGLVLSFLGFSDEFHRHGSKPACYLGERRTRIRVDRPALFHQIFPFRRTGFRYGRSKRVLHNPALAFF